MLDEFTLWDIVRNLLMALRWTVLLSAIAFVGGAIVGAILLLVRLSGKRIAGLAVDAYVYLFQGTPLLIQLFLCYFGLALFGLEISAWTAAVFALTAYSSAFLTEIWRGCVNSVPIGQWEASSSLALTFAQQLRYIVIPQAIKISIPPTVGFMVQVVKATAVASVIGFVELTKAGTMIGNVTFKPFTVFGLVAILYFLICFPISLAARRIERKAHGL